MNTKLRALVLLVLSASLTTATFLFATTALHQGTDEADPIESAIRNAHSDPPARLLQA